MIDLHVHTTASDGQYTPLQIIQKASEKKINRIAITDHDTIDGLEEAEKAAKIYGIDFVRGTELNINRPNCEFHLLAYGFKEISKSFREILNFLVENRNRRNEEIIKKMNFSGVNISLSEMQSEFPDTVIGRPHFARMLVKKGISKTVQKAFDDFLARGKPWYADRISVNLDEAIIAIYESGGVPVIAHPMSLYLSWGKMPEFLKEIHEKGVAGLEAFHPGARMTECLRLEELARKIGFFITAGSDFHGEKIRADRKLGHTVGNKKIDDKFWNEELGKYLSEH